MNPSRRNQLSDKGLKVLKSLKRYVSKDFNLSLLIPNTIQSFEILRLLERNEIQRGSNYSKEIPILLKNINANKRIYKCIGKELDVFFWDTGNGWCSILSIRDKEGKILLGLDKDA